MKRILCYVAILAVVLALPVERADVGDLRPVQAVAVYKQNDWVVIETDTEDIGIGVDAAKALQNLKETAAGIIYLDTAKYLLLAEDAEDAVEDLRGTLKNSVELCMMSVKPDIQKAAKYLRIHGDLIKLKDWETGAELPVLSIFGDSLIFLKKVENSA